MKKVSWLWVLWVTGVLVMIVYVINYARKRVVKPVKVPNTNSAALLANQAAIAYLVSSAPIMESNSNKEFSSQDFSTEFA